MAVSNVYAKEKINHVLTLEQEFDLSNNSLYCPTFHIVWTKLKEKVVKEDKVKLFGKPSIGDILNKTKVSYQDFFAQDFFADVLLAYCHYSLDMYTLELSHHHLPNKQL